MKPLAINELGTRLFFLSALVACIFLAFPVHAGGLWAPSGGRQAGLDHCSVALTGFWGVENNPAGTVETGRISLGMGFRNGYLSPHLGTADAALVYPAPFGNLGLTLRYFGYALYHEMKVGLSYARKLGPKLRAGIQLIYLQTAFGDIYGHRGNFTFALGLQSPVTRNLMLGLYVYNPVPVKLSDYAREKIPSVFRFGLAYSFSPDLLVTVEAEKNTAFQPVVLRGGIEYRFRKQFFFRTGFATSGDIFAFGFGWYRKKFRFDLASAMHPSLGFSPQASVVVHF